MTLPDPETYDARWAEMERRGLSIHGEADFVTGYAPRSVLDAGCGTGRVAIELARRGVDVVGVDRDQQMVDAARAKAPELRWQVDDLAVVDLGARVELVVMAGNVMLFTDPGTEATVVANMARHLLPGGRLVAGFQLGQRVALADYDAWCAAAGLTLEDRFATWERAPFVAEEASYAVSVHRAPGA